MVFDSGQFALFFVLVLALYWRVRHEDRRWLLLVASHVF